MSENNEKREVIGYSIPDEWIRRQGIRYSCDGCGERIGRLDILYHCGGCWNFDFCETCFITKDHPRDHQFYIDEGIVRVKVNWSDVFSNNVIIFEDEETNLIFAYINDIRRCRSTYVLKGENYDTGERFERLVWSDQNIWLTGLEY